MRLVGGAPVPAIPGTVAPSIRWATGGLDIPRVVVSSGGVEAGVAVGPGGVLVVGGVVGQAAVHDADQAVAESAERLVVGVPGGSMLVVVGAGAGAGGQGGKGPQVDRVGEALVAGVAGQHGPPGARSTRDGGRSGVVFATLGGGVPAWCIAELAEHPGAQDGPQSWQGTDHLRVRVRIKIH